MLLNPAADSHDDPPSSSHTHAQALTALSRTVSASIRDDYWVQSVLVWAGFRRPNLTMLVPVWHMCRAVIVGSLVVGVVGAGPVTGYKVFDASCTECTRT